MIIETDDHTVGIFTEPITASVELWSDDTRVCLLTPAQAMDVGQWLIATAGYLRVFQARYGCHDTEAVVPRLKRTVT